MTLNRLLWLAFAVLVIVVLLALVFGGTAHADTGWNGTRSRA